MSAVSFSLAASAAVMGACVGDEPQNPSVPLDASGDAPSSLDGGNETGATEDAGRRCDPDKPFDAPSALSVNTPLGEYGGRLSADERMLLFSRAETPASQRPMNLFLATRALDDGPFESVRELAELNTVKEDEFDPSFMPDGLGIVFSSTSDRDGGHIPEDVYESSRTTLNAPFGVAQPVTIVNTSTFDFHPFLRPDGKYLYFVSSRDAPRPGLYQSARQGGVYAAPTPVEGLGVQDFNPVVYAAGLRILFRRDDDIYMGSRLAETEPFGSITRVDELSTPKVDAPSWASDDGCTVVVTSDRDSDAGMDLYVARRPR